MAAELQVVESPTVVVVPSPKRGGGDLRGLRPGTLCPGPTLGGGAGRMTDWQEMSKVEKTVRVGCTLALATKLVECVRREDVIGAAICGLRAVGAPGRGAEEDRAGAAPPR